MEVLNNIGFDWQVALSNFITFAIIYYILKRWVFGPVSEILNKRRETIEEGVRNAEESQAVLTEAQEQADGIVKDSKKEANSIIAEAKNTGDDLVAKAKSDAQSEADKVHERATQTIKKEQQKMEEELFAHTASLVSKGVKKVLETEVDEAKDKELTEKASKALQDIKANS